VVRDNSGRAVRGEPPVDFEKARNKWQRLVTAICPQSGFISSLIAGQSKGGDGANNNGQKAPNSQQRRWLLEAVKRLSNNTVCSCYRVAVFLQFGNGITIIA